MKERKKKKNENSMKEDGMDTKEIIVGVVICVCVVFLLFDLLKIFF